MCQLLHNTAKRTGGINLEAGGPGSGRKKSADTEVKSILKKKWKNQTEEERHKVAAKDPRQQSLFKDTPGRSSHVPFNKDGSINTTVVKDPEIRFNGQHYVYIGNHYHVIYKDPESRNWYEDQSTSGKNWMSSFLSGTTRDEAVKELVLSHIKKGDLNAAGTQGEWKLQGHTTYQGLKIAIENKKGSTRSGKEPNGKPWSIKMPFDYGYVEGTKGKDKDEVDCFIGPNKNATHVFIVHQKQNGKDKYDEDKCMLGWDSADAAKKAYHSAYNNVDLFTSMTMMSIDEFKEKLKSREGKKIHAADYIADQLIKNNIAMLAGGPGSGRHKSNTWLTRKSPTGFADLDHRKGFSPNEQKLAGLLKQLADKHYIYQKSVKDSGGGTNHYYVRQSDGKRASLLEPSGNQLARGKYNRIIFHDVKQKDVKAGGPGSGRHKSILHLQTSIEEQEIQEKLQPWIKAKEKEGLNVDKLLEHGVGEHSGLPYVVIQGAKLISDQEHNYDEPVNKYRKLYQEGKDPAPIVAIRHKGNLHIVNGNHRAEAAALEKQKIGVWVIDLDKDIAAGGPGSGRHKSNNIKSALDYVRVRLWQELAKKSLAAYGSTILDEQKNVPDNINRKIWHSLSVVEQHKLLDNIIGNAVTVHGISIKTLNALKDMRVDIKKNVMSRIDSDIDSPIEEAKTRKFINKHNIKAGGPGSGRHKLLITATPLEENKIRKLIVLHNLATIASFKTQHVQSLSADEVAKLKSTQDIDPKYVNKYISNPSKINKEAGQFSNYIHVVRTTIGDFVLDGNHRAVAAKTLGQGVKAKVIDLSKELDAGGPGSGRHPYGRKVNFVSKEKKLLQRRQKEQAERDELKTQGKSARGKAIVSEKAKRALASMNVATKAIHDLAEKTEQKVTKALGAVKSGDNSPFDVTMKIGNKRFGLEVKALQTQKNDKITQKNDAIQRKLNFGAKNGIPNHRMFTVAVDYRQPDGKGGFAPTKKSPDLYIHSGVGSFRLGSMIKIEGGFKRLKDYIR